jgi:pimeloyl-ACP methyl ester carboxylesterase
MKIFKSEKGANRVLASYDQLLAKWPDGTAEQWIETRFGSTHVLLAGSRDNPPLLLFHGVGDNSAVMWYLNIGALSRHFYCVAVDTLGGPGKSLPNELYVKKEFDQVVWINELVEKLELWNVNLAGVSNGAYLAWLYASMEPDKVNRVVCLEGGFVTDPWKAVWGTLMLAFPEILLPTRKNLIRIMEKMKPGSDLFEKHPELIEHMVLVMKNHNQQAMFVHPITKYDAKLGEVIRDKVLFLFGGNMMGDRNGFVRLLKEGGYRYEVVEGVGHGINHEKPDLINEKVIAFLSAAN